MPKRHRRFVLVLLGSIGASLSGVVSPVFAETVAFDCVVLPGGDEASIRITNSLDRKASCIVTCKFTAANDNGPQITCAKPVPAGQEIEMCRLTSGGSQIVKAIGGSAQCTR